MLGLVKNQERKQRCNNPRVKGVNTRREFHAWQVCRMAPVFSLFTHANEQYADEQTWAQPRLPAAQNWQEACLCGSTTSSRIPLVCCSFWWLFDGLSLASEISAMYCQYSSWCFWQQVKTQNSFASKLCSLQCPHKITFLITSYSLKLLISCSNAILQWTIFLWGDKMYQ